VNQRGGILVERIENAWAWHCLKKLLRLVWGPVLDIVRCAIERNVYCAVVGWSALYVSVGPNWFLGWFKSSISLLVFCLVT